MLEGVDGARGCINFWYYLGTYYTNAPSGGINSNAIDMSKWLRLQMNRGIFDGKRIVVLFNAGHTSLPEALAFKFFDMYFGNTEKNCSAQF